MKLDHTGECVLYTADSWTSDTYRDDYTHNLDELAVYVGNRAGDGPLDTADKKCGFVTRHNDAVMKARLHVQCTRQVRGRYVYIEASGVTDRSSRLFSAVLCEVVVYE